MKKAEIIKQIMGISGDKKVTVSRVVEAMLSVIKEAIERHEPVQLRGFGKFKVVERKERTVVHPVTKEKLQLPPRKELQFKPYDKFKQAVKEAFAQKTDLELEHRLQEAKTELKRHNPLKAIELYNSVLSQNPREVKARIGLGLAYEAIAEYQKAAEEYEKVLSFQPDNVEAHYNLGAVYWEMGKVEEAQKEFKKALELAPASADAHYNMGVTFYKKGLYQKAIAELQKAITIDPEDTRSYYYLGSSYSQLQMRKKAIEVFEQLLEKEPNNKNVLWQLGLLYDREGRHEEAVQMYRKANLPASESVSSGKGDEEAQSPPSFLN